MLEFKPIARGLCFTETGGIIIFHRFLQPGWPGWIKNKSDYEEIGYHLGLAQLMYNRKTSISSIIGNRNAY